MFSSSANVKINGQGNLSSLLFA